MVVRNLIVSLLALGALLTVATPASAEVANAYPPCAEITTFPVGLYYVQHYGGRVHVWAEANDYLGLQRQSCIDDDGELLGLDAHLNQFPGMHRPDPALYEDPEAWAFWAIGHL